jgi:hypothetical protein
MSITVIAGISAIGIGIPEWLQGNEYLSGTMSISAGQNAGVKG